jgi:TPP-dependent pyruvate/acetoin dehydrogenase alpha subunit
VASQFDCDTYESDSTDAEEIHTLATEAAEKMRSTKRPAFLRLRWYRYLEHVGINEDFDAGYRSREDFLKWQKVDPIALQRRKLLQHRLISEGGIKELEATLDRQVEAGVQSAKAAPLSDSSEVFAGLFA